jgi:hypothetical protein
MGHIVFDDFMPSYGPPKLALVSVFFFDKKYTVIKKTETRANFGGP